MSDAYFTQLVKSEASSREGTNIRKSWTLVLKTRLNVSTYIPGIFINVCHISQFRSSSKEITAFSPG